MLYKAMQVKEIPIIFRGVVNAPEIPTVEPLIDDDLAFEPDPYSPPGIYGATLTGNITDYDELFIKFGDDYFSNVAKYEVNEGVYGYGAPVTIDGYDFSEYPFVIVQPMPDTLIVISNSDNSVNLKIWNEDPQKTPERSIKVFSAELTGNGQIKRFHARFACGENGTLHINPYVILNGNITVNLCDFAKEGENYISGDNEDFTFECYVPIETHAMLYVEAENVGEYQSMLDVAIVVQYEDFIEEESIVGYEGVNLGRKRR